MQLTTNYDDKYNTNFESCLEYIEERVKEIYKVMTDNGFVILYSAILVNLIKETDNPIAEIKDSLMSSNLNNSDFSEIGMKASMNVDDKFYRIITLNNSRDYSIRKEFKTGEFNIIMPLISLYDAKLEREYMSIKYELNDKCSFDKYKEYKNNSNTIDEMFGIVKDDLNENIENFIKYGKII